MDIAKLTAIVTILITLSIATERLVEIIKGFIPSFNADSMDAPEEPKSPKTLGVPASPISTGPTREAKRKAKISILSIVCGIATAFLASPILAGLFKDLFAGTNCKLMAGFASWGENVPCGFDLSGNGMVLVLALGLLASGGSAFWSSILEYLLKIKDLKKSEVKRARIEAKSAEVRLRAETERLLESEPSQQ